MVRQTGIFSMAALTVFLFCGATAPQTCNEPQQKDDFGIGGAIAAGAVAVGVVVIGTVVLVHVHHEHHTVKGCVYASSNGFEVKTDDGKVYALSGDTLNAKEGDLVKFHGNKIKRGKDKTGDQTFVVEKLQKDYGACRPPKPVKPTTDY